MARTKKDYVAPKALVTDGIPEGCERITYTRFLERAERGKKGTPEEGKIISGEDRKVTRNVIAPVEGAKAGESIIAYQDLLNLNDVNGNDFVARSLRNSIVEADFAECKRADDAGQDLPAQDIVLNLSAVRVTDQAEAVGSNLTDWLRAHPGQVPTQEEMLAIFAGTAK